MYDLILWKNRRTEISNTYSIKENEDGTITLTPVFGEVIEAGTSFNQTNMNNMDYGINEAMIIANLAMLQARKNTGNSENTNFEIGTVVIQNNEDYPFNRRTVTVEIVDARSTVDYVVMAFCDDMLQGRAIRVKNQQLYSFDLEIEDCPKVPVTIKYFIMGGKA